MELQFDTFVRKPFTVEAIQVTEENLKSIAKLIGQIQKEPNGTRYIQVHKRKVPNVTRVYPGYWVTRMENPNSIRAYSDRAFTNQFVRSDETQETPVEKFEFSREEDGSLSLESAVFQALGYASMCWSKIPGGIFESDKAKDAGDKLVEFFQAVAHA